MWSSGIRFVNQKLLEVEDPNMAFMTKNRLGFNSQEG